MFLLLYIVSFLEQEFDGGITDQMYTDPSCLPKISAAREQYQNIIKEFTYATNRNDKILKFLTKEELIKLIIQLRDQLFNKNLLTTENDGETNDNNNQILHDLFNRSHNLAELLKGITETLPKQTNIKTIIQLSLAYIFIWTVKAHIIPAYSKYQ